MVKELKVKIKINIGGVNGSYVLFKTRSGHVGVGRICGRECLKVKDIVKAFFKPLPAVDWNIIVEANSEFIEEIANEAKRFLVKSVRKPVYASFSGGKDSQVFLYLAKNVYPI